MDNSLPSRADAIRSAQMLLADERTVFLKVETTGIGRRDEVVEIAIVHALSGDVLVNSLVKPSFRYPMHDKLKHGLTYDMLMDAPLITGLSIEEILNGKKVIVYGKTFAQDQIAQSFRGQDLYFDDRATWHCAMTLYGAFEGVMDDYGRKHKWWKFDDALDNLHVNNTQRNHRALEEAKTIGLLLWQIAYRGDAQTVKAKRDPLPRPTLNMSESEFFRSLEQNDDGEGHSRAGQEYVRFDSGPREDEKPFKASDYYAASYPDDEGEFDSYDDYGGDE